MKPEQKMWSVLRVHIGSRWDAQRHEDELASGIPDVSFGAMQVNGWIELKRLLKWPVRAATIVKLSHPFGNHQRAWLRIRGIYGEHCWMLLQAEKTWLIFGPDRFQYVGTTNREDLIKNASKVWVGKPDPDEFISFITKTLIK